MFLVALSLTLIQLDPLSLPKPVGVVTDYTLAPVAAAPAYVPAQVKTNTSSTDMPATVQGGASASSPQQGTSVQTFAPQISYALSPEQLLQELQNSQPQDRLADVVARVSGTQPAVGSLDRVVLYTPHSSDINTASSESRPLGDAPSSLRGLCDATGNLFFKNHTLGDSGPDITHVQKFLNSIPGAHVAESGAGSSGYETDMFSNKTFEAIKKFQILYSADILTPLGLTGPTGFWGASTRVKANELLCI